MMRLSIDVSIFRSDEVNDKEKFVLSEECELVTMVNVYKGRLEVTTTHVYYFDCSSNKEEGIFHINSFNAYYF